MTSTGRLLLKLEEGNQPTEPALTVGTTTATVAGLLTVVLYFFPHIPDNVIQGILVGTAFVLPIATALLTRGKVWSPDSVQAVVDEAVKKALEAAALPKPAEMTTFERLRLANKPPVAPKTDFFPDDSDLDSDS